MAVRNGVVGHNVGIRPIVEGDAITITAVVVVTTGVVAHKVAGTGSGEQNSIEIVIATCVIGYIVETGAKEVDAAVAVVAADVASHTTRIRVLKVNTIMVVDADIAGHTIRISTVEGDAIHAVAAVVAD